MKKNIILFAVLIVLGALILLLPSKKQEDSEQKKDQPVQLISIREPELKKLTLTQGKQFLTLEKRDKSYFMVQPKLEAGNSEVSSFIAELNTLEGFPVQLPKKSAAETILSVETTAGPLFLKIAGKREMGSPAYYIETNAGTFVIESPKIDKILQTQVDELRNHILTDYTSKDVSEFSINQTRYYQKTEGKWLVEGLGEEETDSNKVFTVFATVSSLRIKKFTHSLNKSQYGLAQPSHQVVLKLKNGAVRRFFLAKQQNNYYCLPENDREIYEINDFDWKYFQKDLSALKKDKANGINRNQPAVEDEKEEQDESAAKE